MSGGERLCMSSVDECNTSSHTQEIWSGEYLTVGSKGHG